MIFGKQNSHFQKFIICIVVDLTTSLLYKIQLTKISKKIPFRFEPMWITDPSFTNLLQSTWASNKDYVTCVFDFQKAATFWNIKHFGNIFQKKKTTPKKTKWHTKFSHLNIQFFPYKPSTLSTYLNQTFISLIPKIPQVANIKDYHPINLCNTTYKIITKIIASRIKQVLPQLISPEQSAFLP